jgi:hypothetical protein
MADLKEQIDFANLDGHVAAGHAGALDALVSVVEINDALETRLRTLDEGRKTGKYTPAFVAQEDRRLRQEAFAKAAPLRERATTLAALADAVDEHLSPEAVLQRARFEPAVGGDDTGRLLAEQVNESKRLNYRMGVAEMTADELATEIERAARDGDHAKLRVLNERIKHEGGRHVGDATWSAAKSKLLTALASLTTSDHVLLPTALEMRDHALDTIALTEQVRTGVEPIRLRTKRVTRLHREGATDLQQGRPFSIPHQHASVTTLANH